MNCPDEKLATMNYRLDVRDKEYYDILVGSGFAYEFYPDLPQSWSEAQKEILAYQAKVEYCRKTRNSNFEASCRLEGIE